jgi:hypothetical protein
MCAHMLSISLSVHNSVYLSQHRDLRGQVNNHYDTLGCVVNPELLEWIWHNHSGSGPDPK